MMGGQDARDPDHFLQTLNVVGVLFGIETHGVFNAYSFILSDARDSFFPAKDDPRNSMDRRVIDLSVTRA